MNAPLLELEGTWEEIAARASELAGRRVRVIVLPLAPAQESDGGRPPAQERPPAFRPASGRSLLRHAGTWAGNDLEECLQEVYASRSKAKF